LGARRRITRLRQLERARELCLADADPGLRQRANGRACVFEHDRLVAGVEAHAQVLLEQRARRAQTLGRARQLVAEKLDRVAGALEPTTGFRLEADPHALAAALAQARQVLTQAAQLRGCGGRALAAIRCRVPGLVAVADRQRGDAAFAAVLG